MLKTKPYFYCRDYVRGENYNLYLLHFFAPCENRFDILALMALHTELHAIPQKVIDPMMRVIRLKWWMDEIDKIQAGKPYADSPVLEALSKTLTAHKINFDDYFDRFGQSLRGEQSDIDEAFYGLLTSVIHDEKSKSRSKFIKKLMHHDRLEDTKLFRALRMWLGV
jgi:phytoene/squalene synthetase